MSGGGGVRACLPLCWSDAAWLLQPWLFQLSHAASSGSEDRMEFICPEAMNFVSYDHSPAATLSRRNRPGNGSAAQFPRRGGAGVPLCSRRQPAPGYGCTSSFRPAPLTPALGSHCSKGAQNELLPSDLKIQANNPRLLKPNPRRGNLRVLLN